MSQNGSIKIHLGELLKESGLSKNKFCQKAEIQRSQLNGYVNNTITRLDTEVLVRICRTLKCSIADCVKTSLLRCCTADGKDCELFTYISFNLYMPFRPYAPNGFFLC